jgi:hypothetical protein
VEQAPIRLKNLLRQATHALKTDGVRAPEIDRLLAPLRRLLETACSGSSRATAWPHGMTGGPVLA